VQAYQADGWTALGDPTRRAIFERLADHPWAVGELARELPVSRPAVSQHLKVLKDARLVVDRRDGNRRIYHLDPDGVGALRADLERFWSKALAAYKTVVEQPTKGGPMSTQAAEATVQTQVVVEAPIERAFRVFTEDFGSFKPPEHNLLDVEIAETVFEPREGGHLYDRGVDGSECRWARVLAYEPPDRVVISWDIDPRWQIETDLEKTSEVEVRFISETPERTRVELEHRKLDRHGDGWEGVREGVGGEGGWPLYLQRFAQRLAVED
jgi:DNA-binding transcriptional ArsR family regulator